MNRREEWDEYLNSLLSHAVKEHKVTREYDYLKSRLDVIDEMLTTNLSSSQKELVEECLFEIYSATDREAEVVYKQGLKDCAWLLKNLGVLA